MERSCSLLLLSIARLARLLRSTRALLFAVSHSLSALSPPLAPVLDIARSRTLKAFHHDPTLQLQPVFSLCMYLSVFKSLSLGVSITLHAFICSQLAHCKCWGPCRCCAKIYGLIQRRSPFPLAEFYGDSSFKEVNIAVNVTFLQLASSQA